MSTNPPKLNNRKAEKKCQLKLWQADSRIHVKNQTNEKITKYTKYILMSPGGVHSEVRGKGRASLELSDAFRLSSLLI